MFMKLVNIGGKRSLGNESIGLDNLHLRTFVLSLPLSHLKAKLKPPAT